ncbi:MAG: hypothetical protein J6386_06990 [Candidatus Synoicihabitans palmerolidicus]|nr:hypothetical protein [Candidatus Synoicihabitans palmerolidicus]
MSQVFIEMCGEADRASELGLAAAQPMDTCLVDSTCLQANIHFPVDWVLFRPLLKAVKLLRAAGLRGRMPNEPPVFAKQMNRWCIAMTHSPTAPRCEAGPQGRAPPDETPAAHHRRARPPPPRPPRRRLRPDPLQ